MCLSGEVSPLLGGVLKGDTLVSVRSATLGSGALNPLGFCRRVAGFEGTLGFAVLFTGGGTFTPCCGSGIDFAAFGLLAKSIFGGGSVL